MKKGDQIKEIINSMHKIDNMANSIGEEIWLVHERLKLICEHNFDENNKCKLCGHIKGEPTSIEDFKSFIKE